MKYKAVIFDLFGTLIPNMSLSEHKAVLVQMAHFLSTTPDGFAQLWFDTFNERSMGIFQSPEDNIEYICRVLGISVNETQVKLAAQTRFDYSMKSIKPRPQALQTLSQLKSLGCKIGLISDCSSEVPAIWKNTPFAELIDVAIFSCSVGIRKPDIRIYQLSAKQLEVKPQDCLYMGDGSSRELSGAMRAGMNPILIRALDEPNDAHQIEAEKWDGPTISSLQDVLSLAK